MKLKLLLAFCLTAYLSYSQLSVSIENKYGLRIPGSYDTKGFFVDETETNFDNTYISRKFCLGNGYQVGVLANYTLQENFGVELGAGYLLGSASEYNYNYIASSGSSTLNYEVIDVYSARFTRLKFGFSYIGEKTFAPVIKMGGVLGLGKVFEEFTYRTTAGSTLGGPSAVSSISTTIKKTEIFGGAAIGFYSAIGFKYSLFDKIDVAVLLDVVLQNYSPKHAKLVKYTIDGVDQLPSKNKQEKEIDFLNEYTDNKSSTNVDEPLKASKIGLPLSSYGPSISITYKFGE